jgi:ribosomal protein S20
MKIIRFLCSAMLLVACSHQPSDSVSEKNKIKKKEVAAAITETESASKPENGESEPELDSTYQTFVRKFIKAVKSGDSKQIAPYFSYPLEREYPIPSIATAAEFQARFDELFDVALRNEIIHSNPATDWSEVGWRGIMLNNGTLWMDTDGKIIGVNYQTEVERKLKERLIREDKFQLVASLRLFKAPCCVLETAKFRIRIDELADGKYRYASWPLQKKMTEEPDLILKNGELVIEGTGGNHYYRYTNNGYTYLCYRIIMGEGDAPPARLVIQKNGQEILNQPAQLVQK